jgi:glycosyltransferase involved in cell wall biosynthesis
LPNAACAQAGIVTRSIRVLHCLGTLNPGGVEIWLMTLLKHLDTKHLQFDFCTFGPEAGLHASEAERLGAVVHRCPQHPSSSLGQRFRQVLREGRYDVVHSHVHLFSGALLRWASLEGVPIRVAHSHSSHDGKPDSLARTAYRKLMKNWIQRHATQGLASSGKAAADLFGANWQSDPRIAILHYGIDLQAFRIAADPNTRRAEAGLSEATPVIGHVGNFVAAKNHKFFLEIAVQIRKRLPEAHFLLIGDGPLRAQIETRAQELGLQDHAHFLGTRSDVPSLMRTSMDALLFPSLWEGLPLTVIEAQAAGLPNVISDEIADEAVLFPERVQQLSLSSSPEIWADETILMMKLGKLDSRAATHAIEKTDFTIERSLSRLMDLYSRNKVIARAAAG